MKHLASDLERFLIQNLKTKRASQKVYIQKTLTTANEEFSEVVLFLGDTEGLSTQPKFIVVVHLGAQVRIQLTNGVGKELENKVLISTKNLYNKVLLEILDVVNK